MPSTGTPREKISLSGRGAPLSWTLEGPPERIIPFGAKARISSMGALKGRISE
jgi:hypothetical protein